MNNSANFNAFSMVKIKLKYLAIMQANYNLFFGGGVGCEECEEGWRKIRNLFIFLLTKYEKSLNIPRLKN